MLEFEVDNGKTILTIRVFKADGAHPNGKKLIAHQALSPIPRWFTRDLADAQIILIPVE